MTTNFIYSGKRKQISAFLLLALIGLTVQAQVRWHANPDLSTNRNNFFRQFDTAQSKTTGDCDPSGTSAASVGTVVEGSYGRVWRIRKPKGRQRAEFARTEGDFSSSQLGNFNHPAGSGYYYGWRFKISGSIPSSDKVTVWQWKTAGSGGSQNYPLNMEYAGGKLMLEAWGPCLRSNGSVAGSWKDCSGSIAKRRTTLATVNLPENTWADIVLRIVKNDDPNRGSVEFWFNGVKQTLGNAGANEYRARIDSSGKKAFHRTNDGSLTSAHSVYPKWGAYNGKACKYNITTFLDEMRVATSLSAASPATHNPVGGTSGGSTTDVSGSWFTLRNVATNRYMDGNGENVGTSTSSSGHDKQFRFVKRGDFYNIDIRKSSGTGTGIMRTVASENRLKITNLSPRSDGDKLYDVRRISDGVYSIRATNANKYLQNNTSNTVTLTTKAPSSNNRARWRFNRIASAKGEEGKLASETNTATSVTIYPNPVTSQFNIALKGLDKADITISDILGKVVYTTSTTNNEISLSKSNGFSNGVYILKVSDTKGQSYIKKFVVQ